MSRLDKVISDIALLESFLQYYRYSAERPGIVDAIKQLKEEQKQLEEKGEVTSNFNDCGWMHDGEPEKIREEAKKVNKKRNEG